MPEGHTIHRLAADIARDLVSSPVRVSSPQGRFEGADRVSGAILVRTSAVGKHLFLHFESGTVHVHLGLFGKFRREKSPPPEPRGALRMRMEGASHTWDLRGPTACDIVDDGEIAALLARLGADPLSADADPKRAWKKVRASKRSIGALLLDQSVFSGIGNVYRAEILFLLGLHPEVEARTLPKRQFDRLWALMQTLLARGVREKRIVTRDAPPKKRLSRRDALYVYKRSACAVCAAPVHKLVSAARPLYFCPRCQPAPVVAP